MMMFGSVLFLPVFSQEGVFGVFNETDPTLEAKIHQGVGVVSYSATEL